MTTATAGTSSGELVARLHLGEPLEFFRLIWAIDHGLQLASKRMEASLGVTGL